MYNHRIVPLPPSKPKIPIEDLMEATKPEKPFPWAKETDMKVDGGGGLFYWIARLFRF